MKIQALFAVVVMAVSLSSCQRDTIIYRTKPAVVHSTTTRSYSAPQSAPSKLPPGLPTRIGDPSPASTSTTY